MCVSVPAGSNTGIGKMTAIDLAKRGARVVLACRSRERGEAALADVKRVRPHPRLVSPPGAGPA